MNVSLIIAHPDPASFNHALARTVTAQLESGGHRVCYHDLCKEHFPPELPSDEIPKSAALPELIRQHCLEISNAWGIIIIHPNWWGQPPAVLKGWIDRVIRPGVAYQFVGDDQGEGTPVGLLKAKSVLVLNTSNTARDRENRVFGDPLETIWKNCVFGLCGVNDFHRQVFRVIVTSTLQERQNWLNEARELTEKIFGVVN
jgi:NAD(P)H dehydrogenase (quinone)